MKRVVAEMSVVGVMAKRQAGEMQKQQALLEVDDRIIQEASRD